MNSRLLRLCIAAIVASPLAMPALAPAADTPLVAAPPAQTTPAPPSRTPLPLPTASPAPEPSGSAPPAPGGTSTPQAAIPVTIGLPTGLPSGITINGGNPQAYAAFVRHTERQSGLIDTVRKDDELYFDLGADQLDHPYVVAPILASGIGSEAFAGRVYPSFVLEFKRVGKRILWIVKNTDFTAPPGSAAANSLAVSVTDSVINSTPIVAEDENTKRVVISASFFLSDFENVGRDIGGRGAPIILLGALPAPRFAVDTTRSYIERTKALPKNDEILANLAFSGPPGEVGGAPDGRGVRIRMHYSIVEPPAADGYVPRLADDRVGYFVTSQVSFDNDTLPSPIVRYIDRWNFANGPIVYYLTNEIPAQYKPAIRAALLKWNTAFSVLGIPNAIEVKDQPSDPAWDPDDVRYSTVRWITSENAAFAAYGPHIADPRTGEIMRVEIVIDGESLRAIKRGYVDRVRPLHEDVTTNSAGLPQLQEQASYACDNTEECDDFAEGSAEYAALGTVALRAQGATPAQTEKFAEDWLEAVVLHESGHNFGLRHNFAASMLYPYAKLHDKSFTSVHGLVGSVMEYTPTNLSPKGEPQGNYFQSQLGPYDLWAIRYGYEKFPNVKSPGDEAKALRAIADESTRPEYRFATDEDANGPLAIDPRVATFDLSNDPLAYDSDQFDLIHQLTAGLEHNFPRDDRPYAEERDTFVSMLNVYARASLLATKYVGGMYTSRDHRGQAGGAPPLAVVPRAQSRRAFELLSQNVFSSKAFAFSPQLLGELGASHYFPHGEAEQPDFPLSDTVADLQDRVMFRLFSPDAMSRLANAQYVAGGKATMTLPDLFGWMQASVWDDLKPSTRSIEPLHRNLQRRYTTLLIAMSLAPTFVVGALGYPPDTVPLAGFQLRRLSHRIDETLRSPHLDTATRAHLEDLRARIDNGLKAHAVRGA